MDHNEQRILTTWQRNAVSWTRAVRDGTIASRQQVTDQAIVEVIQKCQPKSVIDIGCGEGWLARRLSGCGMAVTGVDATQALIDTASASGGGNFTCLDYTELHSLTHNTKTAPFDLAVCNFSLLGKSSTEAVLAQIPTLTNTSGHLVIQTLHPAECDKQQLYQDGWRQSTWDGFDSSFTDPAPWYFRTLPSWLALLRHYGLGVREILEPLSADTGRPVSIIFIAALAR